MIVYKDFIKEKVNNEIKIKSAEGYPCEFKKSNGRPLKDYKIYGNSVQDGTPTPENPIEVESVGDLVSDIQSEYYGKYAVPITINDSITINIYLDEPLRKIGDYADYVDFKRKKVVRNVKPYVLTGDKGFAKYSSKENTACYSQRILYTNWFKNNFILCTHFRWIESAVYDTVGFAHGDTSGIVYFRIPIDAEYAQSSTTFQAWVKEQYNNGTPIVIYATPPDGVVEEDIELPEITTAYGFTIMTSETVISPSNIEVKYVIK